MREIIAQRVRPAKGAKVSSILQVIVGVCFIIGASLAIALIPDTHITFLGWDEIELILLSWIILGVGVFCAVAGTVFAVRAYRKSDVFVAYENGVFYFQDGSPCLVSEVTNVNYQNGETIVAPVTDFPDSLTIEVGEKVYSYTNVEKYKKAQARILALMLESAKADKTDL